MVRLFLLLTVVVAILAKAAQAYSARSLSVNVARHHYRSSHHVLHSTGSLGSMGSDVLHRPDDEDSPEYRDYLKKLLKLQANRAKNGFAAPSSGSSDAYLAKLNRIKVERMALRDAGLPDADIDLSYKNEDYVNAVSEMAEPLVSNSVLSGDAAIPGRQKAGKLRQLSAAEVEVARLAEENVARILASHKGALLKKGADSSITEGYDPIKKLTAPNADLDPVIDQLLDNMFAKKEVPRATTAPATANAQSGPKYDPPPGRAAATPVQKQAPPAPTRVITPPAPAAAPVQKQQPVAAAKAVVEVKRKLDTVELEVAAEALKSLVKHRGGGPFGAGRLQGFGAREMKKNLEAAVQMLLKDASVAPVVENAAPVARAASVAVPVQRAAPAVAPAAVPVVADIAKCPVMSDSSSPLPVMNAQQELEYPESLGSAANDRTLPKVEAEGQPVPIALGLDKFLQAPRSLQPNELSALRDALIQCLSMVQNEVTARSQVSLSVDAANPMERLLASAVRAEQQAAGSSGSDTMDKDLKVALGMLLKHRGGPGFGHGRLEGRELQLMKEKLTGVAQRLVAEAK